MVKPRSLLGALLIGAVVSLSPAAARAQLVPLGDEDERAPVTGDLEAPEGSRRSGPRLPLVTAGSIFAGLGGMSLMAASITWIVAAGNAAGLDNDCPNKMCVEGSIGADRLQTARDAEKAAAILTGIGTPMLAGGMVLLLYASAFPGSGSPRKDSPLRAAPVFAPGFAGGTFQARF